MSYGLVTTRPTSALGSDLGVMAANYLFGQKVGIAAGVWSIAEIGTYGLRYLSSPAVIDMRIYTNDLANGCPETLIANSSSGDLSWTETDVTIKYSALSGCIIDTSSTGTSYWIVFRTQDARFKSYAIATGSISFYLAGTWPTDPDDWHSKTATATDYCNVYAVYSAYSGIRTLFRP